MPPFRDKDICGLDVTVNDALGMRDIKRVGDLNAQRKQPFVVHRSFGDRVFQSQAVQKLHGDERLSVVFSDVVNRADIGVI